MLGFLLIAIVKFTPGTSSNGLRPFEFLELVSLLAYR